MLWREKGKKGVVMKNSLYATTRSLLQKGAYLKERYAKSGTTKTHFLGTTQ